MGMISAKGTHDGASGRVLGIAVQWASPARALPLAFLVAALSLVVVTVTLGVTTDGAGWAEAMAAAGIVASVIGTAFVLSTSHGWSGSRESLAGVATALFGVVAVALAAVTYIGGASDAGIASSGSQVSKEGSALLSQQTNNEVQPPGYAHDIGNQPTVSQFLSYDNATVLANVPGGTVLPTEVGMLRSEVEAAREFALNHNTVEKARAAGYFNTTNDVPFMGAHFLNSQYLSDGVFDASKPEGLLFSKLGNPEGEWQLVGVWYLLLPDQGGATVDAPPEGFTGSLDLWHAHYGLCTRAGIISENNTFDSCQADNGNWIGDLRWMMHAWVYPESGADNSDGVFVYLNSDLYEKQQVASPGIGRGLGQPAPGAD
jgi:hypothetical protein